MEEFAANSPSGFHVTYFKSRQPAVQGGSQYLHMFYAERDDFENLEATDSADVYFTATPYFLRLKRARTLHRFQDMLTETMDKPYPIVKTHKPTHTFKHDIKIGYRAGRLGCAEVVVGLLWWAVASDGSAVAVAVEWWW